LTIRRNNNSTQRRTRFILVVVGLVLLAGSLYSVSLYVLSHIAALDMVSEISWEKTISGSAWSFQRELTILADDGGLLIPIAYEGERVSKGLEIARLNYQGENKLNEATNRRLFSPVAGIVSFETDGLEIISTARDYNDLTIWAMESLIGPAAPERSGQGFGSIIQDRIGQESVDREAGQSGAEGGRVPANNQARTQPREVPPGAAMLKVIDNLSDCYVYMRLPDQEEPPFALADLVLMKLEGAGDGKGTVMQCEAIQDGWGMLMKLEFGLEALRLGRRHQLSLVLGTEARAVAPHGAVVTKDGETGVYVMEKNRAHWVPVSVIGEQDDYQIIEGLSQGDVIVTRPLLVWDGMRLRS
jgi:hypothetical protein